MNLEEAFEAFQLPNNASKIEVKKRYKILVLEYHPDRNNSPDATQKFILVTDAYKILLDYCKEEQQQQNNDTPINPGDFIVTINGVNVVSTWGYYDPNTGQGFTTTYG